ncbi:hypothetical protein A1O1_08037 [Capronia coronata CBS 617.96]|uniref:Uncharacterized protein n=1 Tax=Capronia coronata CBS 617.96 TaxID=1182541 RepID=W9XX86_9EURO|nr:uncharacterized protein A1O1_08037 [Capronia coronata CBS 617.96]EXJ81970.1 hypothetical protein A1O1_08037 [Capronia coronata CBS 617.96]
MSTPTTNFVRTGARHPWHDLSRGYFNSLQCLVTTSHSFVWTSATGITLAALLFLFAFAQFYWVLRGLNLLFKSQTLKLICETMELSRGGLNAIGDLWKYHIRGYVRPGSQTTTTRPRGICVNITVVLIAILLVVVFFGFNIGMAFTSKLATDTLGLSDSPFCDIWQHPSGVLAPAAQVWEEEAERRARLYVSTCDGKPTGTDGCNLYFNQSIRFHVTNTSCPFQLDTCDGAGGPPLRFDTDYFDSRILGLNIRNSPRLRRETVCSPVVTDERYVRFHTSPYGLRATEYYYGNGGPNRRWNGIDSEFTYNSSVTFTKDIPSYSVATFRSKSSGDYAYILPEFRVPNHTTTLLIIEDGQLFYPEKRQDPVFAAHNQTSDPLGLN